MTATHSANNFKTKQIKVLFTSASRLKNVIAELSNLLVKLCVGSLTCNNRQVELLSVHLIAKNLANIVNCALSWKLPTNIPARFM